MKADFYTRTLAACKLWLRRLALRTLRKLVDLADDRLHSAEVRLRDELAAGNIQAPQHRSPVDRPLPAGETFLQWEARRSGVAVVSKKYARRRGIIRAAEFDLRFTR